MAHICNYLDETLEIERQNCEDALGRFNAPYKLRAGVGAEMREKLFWKVIDPSKDTVDRVLVACNQKLTLTYLANRSSILVCTTTSLCAITVS